MPARSGTVAYFFKRSPAIKISTGILPLLSVAGVRSISDMLPKNKTLEGSNPNKMKWLSHPFFFLMMPKGVIEL